MAKIQRLNEHLTNMIAAGEAMMLSPQAVTSFI